MELNTTELKMAYLLGYANALAEQHAKEFNRDKATVFNELLKMALEKPKF